MWTRLTKGSVVVWQWQALSWSAEAPTWIHSIKIMGSDWFLKSHHFLSFLTVNPLIKSKEQLVAAPLGYNITLECYVESVPRPVSSWFTKDGKISIIIIVE